jgi:hypothetical protein
MSSHCSKLEQARPELRAVTLQNKISIFSSKAKYLFYNKYGVILPYSILKSTAQIL